MQSKRGGLDWLGARARGGVGYWRGRVFSGGIYQQGAAGVDIEQSGGADRGAVGEPAARAGLLESLAGQAKRGGASGGAGVVFGKHQEEGLHGGHPVRCARYRLVVSRRGMWRQILLPLCQRVVDTPKNGQSVISMAL